MAYMVKLPDGTLAITRGGWAKKKSARDAFVKSLPRSVKPRTWKRCYALGCRVVFVDFREVVR